MLHIHKAPTGPQKQQSPNQMVLDATAFHPLGPVETYRCSKDGQDLLLFYSDASTLSRSNLLSPSLVVPFSSLKAIFGTASVTNIAKIIQDSEFDAHDIKI